MTSGRVTLVTGGARRVGAAIVRSFAARGDAVVVHHGHSPMEAAALAEELRAQGAQAEVIACDLSQPEGPERLIDDALRVFGRLDVVISSASRMTPHRFGSVTSAEWDETAAINLRAPFLLMQAAARAMREGGVIVQMSDHLAFETGFPTLIPHAVTKSALTQLVRAAAVQLAPAIRVNAVAPGLVLAPEGFDDETAFLRDVPLARSGTPDDVVQAIHFLVDAPYVTGIVLPVDGGRHLRR